jgi:hypothetical protein
VVYCKFADHNGQPLVEDFERLCGAGDDTRNLSAMAHVGESVGADQVHAMMPEESGGEKFLVLPLPGEISYHGFTG